MDKRTKKFIYVTLLSAMAMMINMFESVFLVNMPLGIRFGFANIIALITVELFSIKDMITVNAMRVILGNLLRGTILGASFFLSCGGVLLSSIMIIISKKVLKLPLMSVSMLSAVGHSIGQVLVVMVLYNTKAMFSIVPLLLITSIPTGLLTGYITQKALNRIKF